MKRVADVELTREYDEALRCVKCGFCLQSCPTYVQLGIETASPRGRLSLIRAVAEGRLPLGDDFADPMYLCLGCRACETACPSGLHYGRALEGARAAVEPHLEQRRPWWQRALRRIAFDVLLPHPGRLRRLAGLLGLAQRSGALALAARLLPAHVRPLALALPPAPAGARRRAWARLFRALPGGAGHVAPAAGQRRYRVAFLPGCVMDALFLPVNLATVRLLTRAGCEVVVPAGMGCCGALHAHSGRRESAGALARRNLAALAAAEAAGGPVDAIINNAGGCGAHLKEYGHLLPGDAGAAAFAARCRDLSEWLAEVGLPPAVRPLPLTVTYQESCHLSHGQRVRQQPRRLLQAIPGLKLVEMAHADRCCGSAGIYNLLQPEMAGALQREKVAAIGATGAPVVVTANPGCHLQLLAGLQQAGLAGRVEVRHIAELLDAATDPHPQT